MKKPLVSLLSFILLSSAAFADEQITPIEDIVKTEEAHLVEVDSSNPTPCQKNGVSGRSIAAGATSLLIWPGIGQAINDNKGSKVATHAVLGILVPPFRFWSAYDATVDRKCGYWKGRI